MNKIILEIDLTYTSDRGKAETLNTILNDFINQNIVWHSLDLINGDRHIKMEWLNKEDD